MVATLKARTGVILVAMGPLAAQAAREGAPELPLVFCMVQDPARLGLPRRQRRRGRLHRSPSRTSSPPSAW